MRLQDFISSKPMTRLGIVIGRHMPRQVGYGLARITAGIIARQKPEVYWTVRANLRQILGPEADDGLATACEVKPHATLHRMTYQVFFHAGQTYYDFFHAIGQPKEVLAEAVRIPDEIVAFVRSETARGRGVLVLGTHMSNFDLLGLSVGARDLPMQMLSLANPRAGFHLLNHLRATAGFEVTPITPQSLRAAIRRLKSGGIVLTGMDRPIPEDHELIEFFGRPAYLPVGPVRLALMTGALVIMGSCYYEPDRGYALEVTEPLEMIRTGHRRQDILTNIRRLASILEEHVRARPEQWMMFHAVWPEQGNRNKK
jgi:lauroyl/myristoyl acyltransferase